MEVSGPPLPPRYETFCRYVARGATLTAAAVEAGYSPASARRRGSELYARDDIQRRIGLLTSARTEAEDARREDYLQRLQSLYDDCVKNGERRTALRVLTLQLQLHGLDTASLNRRARTEQARQAAEAELRDRMRAELRDEIRAEFLDELEALGREVEQQEPAPAPVPAEAPQTMTNQDISAETSGPALERELGTLIQALEQIHGDTRGAADVLAMVGAGTCNNIRQSTAEAQSHRGLFK